jgi:hypothetical protein
MSIPSENLSGLLFTFDSGIATDCGVNAAIVFNYILSWVKHNMAHNLNFREDRYWMYQNVKAMTEYFGFFTTKQIRTAIEVLLEKEYIIKEKLNNNPFNQTNWYTTADCFIKNKNTICPVGQIDVNLEGKSDLPSRANVYKEKRSNERSNLERYAQARPPTVQKSITKRPKALPYEKKIQAKPKRDIPAFLNIIELSKNDQQILANSFSDSQLARALEDARSYAKKKGTIANFAAFMTTQCKSYVQNQIEKPNFSEKKAKSAKPQEASKENTNYQNPWLKEKLEKEKLEALNPKEVIPENYSYKGFTWKAGKIHKTC